MRVAIVMPPATELAPDDALDRWPTVVQQAAALREHAGAEVMVACRSMVLSAGTRRAGVPYRFAVDDRRLVLGVREWRPDVVHVHGLGFTRLTIRLGRALHGCAAIVLQHHGEVPDRGRTVLAHRVARRYVNGYLFTGASTGQAQPFVECGMLGERAQCHEVLEAASTLLSEAPPVELAGSPSILWVGRLIESKDPLTAVAAFALAAEAAMPEAHLHMLATDRSLERRVRVAIDALGPLSERIHLHEPVTPAAMAGWYSAADVYFSTSWREGSGYALVEALTEGCAPVVTSIPSHLAIVGDLGPTFAPGDVIAAAGLLIGAPAMDRAYIRLDATRRLSWVAVAAQLVAAYTSVLVSGGVPRVL